MRYIAIFKDGSVSLPYPNKDRLVICNEFRMQDLHIIIISSNIEDEQVSIRKVHHEMKLPYICACQGCQDRTMDIN